MGFLDAVIGFVEKMGEDDASQESVKHAAVRLADEEERWVKEEIGKIVIEAYVLSQSKDENAEKKIRERLRQFGEDCFKRGAKAASRMNVIAE